MMDFAAGFMGLDPAGNDGHKYGYWPWQIEGWPVPTGKVFAPTTAEGVEETPKEAPKEAPEGGAAKPAEKK